MQIITGNIPRFHPKYQNPNLSSLRFTCSLGTIFETFLLERKFYTFKNEQTSYTVCYFEERAALFFFKITSKMTLMSRKWKKNIFNVSYTKFWFLNENVQQRTNALFIRPFEVQLQFHVRWEPQNGRKNLLFVELVTFYWKLSKFRKLKKLQFLLLKVSQNDLKPMKILFFKMLIFFSVNISRNFVMQEQLDPSSLQCIGKLFCCFSWNPGHENWENTWNPRQNFLLMLSLSWIPLKSISYQWISDWYQNWSMSSNNGRLWWSGSLFNTGNKLRKIRIFV